MPRNKNQHFIPKMYLRLFGNADGASIGVFNLASGHFVRVASIRDQASKPWFYDRDGEVERGLAHLEGGAARLLADILKYDRLPPPRSSAYYVLLRFVALQRERTQAAAADLDERNDRYMKAMLRYELKDREMIDNLDLVRFKRTEVVAEAVLAAHLGTPILHDLKAKLIKNVSGRAFYISDAPIVLHNRLYRGTGAPAEGYGNVGLQILMPIGPWRAILFYDDTAYEVGRPASKIVRLVNPDTASLINDLQWEAAYKTLYISPATDESELHHRSDHWRERRKSERLLLTDKVIENESGEIRVRIGVGRQPSGVALDLPFVRTRLTKPAEWRGDDHPPLRLPEWYDYVLGLAEMVENEALSFVEFSRRTLVPPGARTFRTRQARAIRT
ncbi:MAG: DUF4238 domain-containing protein [Sphingopyxis sp.]|nr:DUF4238 domain-containing protein [Sphingopyxis sp.]